MFFVLFLVRGVGSVMCYQQCMSRVTTPTLSEESMVILLLL